MPSRFAVPTTVLIGATSFALFLVFRASNLTADGISYALAVKSGQPVVHPHHLLYLPIVRTLAGALSWGCRSCDAVLAGQVHDSAWSAVAVASAYLVGRRLFASETAGLTVALGLVSLRGVWVYATQIDAYMPAVGSLAIPAALLIARRKPTVGGRDRIAVALLLSLAVLYHQVNVLFVAPLVSYLAATRGRRGLRAAMVIVSLAGVIAFGVYVLAFAWTQDTRTVGAFIRFCLTYMYHPNLAWGTLSNVGPGNAAVLLRNLVVQVAGIATLPSTVRYPGLLIFGTVIAAVYLWNARQVARGAAHAAVRIFLLAWILVYFAFFLWWLPSEAKFPITMLFPLTLLAALTVQDLAADAGCSDRGRRAVALTTALLITLLGGLSAREVVALHRSRGPAYEEARILARVAPRECVVLANLTVQGFLGYYFDRHKSREVDIPLLLSYQRQPVVSLAAVLRDECLVMPLRYAVPQYEPVPGVSGHRDPRGWLLFVTWLLDLDHDVPRGTALARAVQLIRDEDGSLHLLIRPMKVRVDGVRPVLESLDSRIVELRGGGTPPFSELLARISVP